MVGRRARARRGRRIEILMRIVLLGAPGSGKGTQSALIEEKYGIPQVSTGDILRAAIAEGTSVGKKAEEYVNSGRLVSDEVMLELVRERIGKPDAQKGFILDGFPRTIPQAEGLDRILGERDLELDRVIKIDVPKKTILERMTSRRVCANCGAVYNLLSKLPEEDGVCDVCGKKELHQREDDTDETVRKRLHVYEAATAPLIDFYDMRKQLVIVDGDRVPQEVFADIERHLA